MLFSGINSSSLSFTEIEAEWDNDQPWSMSEFYAGGSTVYSGAADGDGNAGWINLGAGAGGAANLLGAGSNIRGNPKTIAEDIIIPDPATDPTYENSFTIGPSLSIASGYTVTVPNNVVWRIFD